MRHGALLRSVAQRGRVTFSQARKVLIVSKNTRYEAELRRGAEASKAALSPAVRHTHLMHEACVRALVRGLQRMPYPIDVRVVKCYGELRREHILDADLVFSAGGDGTFLRTASFIQDIESPPILCGINSDPSRSEGYLCVSSQHGSEVGRSSARRRRQAKILEGEGAIEQEAEETVGAILARLAREDVVYVRRQRIRVSIASDEDVSLPSPSHSSHRSSWPRPGHVLFSYFELLHFCFCDFLVFMLWRRIV
eukprot:TRINITY_DN34644_c0_g1_i1.p1 TRINITY_DN34644_c0_g1~~TRINITY_DN34644_c0_g1_i1.p1  ORF type:complete len:252 (-),score=30.69 TRINITY_DN34644_c0_g1_i1:30-785(-)